MKTHRLVLAPLCLLLFASALRAQDDSTAMLDQLAGLINRGNLNVEVNLKPGSLALTPAWTLQTIGSPTAALAIEADQGRVKCVKVDVSGGNLLVVGKGLRPTIFIEGMEFEPDGGVVNVQFRGRGAWRPLIALFRSIARPALRRLDIPTDIHSLLMGQILGSKQKANEPAPDFLALVRNVHIGSTSFEAFPQYPLAFGDLVRFDTSSLRATIDNATFTPPARFEADGHIDGQIENGSASFIGSQGRFARGTLENGAFRVAGQKVTFSAASLAVDLTSGTFHWPGGPKVAIDAPSQLAIRSLRVNSDGAYSGIVDATVNGKVGTIKRAGFAIAASDVKLTTHGAKIADGKATGDIMLEFEYRLRHTLQIHYPVDELRDRRVPLDFDGAFLTRLHFEDAGDAEDGAVSGTYELTIPWAPVEKAAFEALKARWQQDLPPAIHHVDFAIEPRRFGPCGPDCFVLDVGVSAEKPKKKGYWFQQVCNSEGKADVVVDAQARSLMLRNLHVEPRCEGVLGAVVNFIAPFLTKSYSDITLLEMPKDLPFTIDSVGSSANSMVIKGKVAWSADRSGAAPQTSR